MSRLHPSSALLAGYATGELPLAPGFAVSAHLETCEDCRAQVARFEQVESDLLAGSPPAALAPGALSRALEGIDASPELESEPVVRRETLADVRLPAAVARAGLGRRRWLAPGIWTATVRAPRTEGWRTLVLRAPAGMKIPAHEHGGRELIAVLQGAFSDGLVYAAGDFAEHDSGSSHRLQITSDGPCACLISFQGRARWHGLASLVAPLLGM